tara:strand:+ start:2179 stop:2337 length:159 start_codon:yes stop_codon:yes gene_type:complete
MGCMQLSNFIFAASAAIDLGPPGPITWPGYLESCPVSFELLRAATVPGPIDN